MTLQQRDVSESTDFLDMAYGTKFSYEDHIIEIGKLRRSLANNSSVGSEDLPLSFKET